MESDLLVVESRIIVHTKRVEERTHKLPKKQVMIISSYIFFQLMYVPNDDRILSVVKYENLLVYANND